MGFSWDEQSIQWFLDASAYTDFHYKLARRILPYLQPGYTLCDVGCGLGRLDLELAPHVSSITAVDIDENVIAELQRDVALLDFRNLHTSCADVNALTDCFDVVIMSFFGKPGVHIDEYSRHCRRKLIRIVNAENAGNLYPSNHRRFVKDTIPTVQQELDSEGRQYELVASTIEFGQPLRSWQDAEKFVLHNAPEASEKEINDFLHKKAVHTGRGDFPIYLPNPKKIGVFVIFKEE